MLPHHAQSHSQKLCYTYPQVRAEVHPESLMQQNPVSDLPWSELFNLSRVSSGEKLSSKKRCLQRVAEMIESSIDDELDDSVDMEVIDALAARERLGCTGLGHGVAIPHGRVDFIEQPIATAIVLQEPVDFDSPDDQPVDIVIGLLMPEEQTDAHLQILARLATMLSQEENRELLRQAKNDSEILTLLNEQMSLSETKTDSPPDNSPKNQSTNDGDTKAHSKVDDNKDN